MRHNPPLFISPLLDRPGQAHLFSTRVGGRPEEHVGACNMHFRKGGTEATALHNRALLMDSVGLDPNGLRLVDQSHGGRVITVSHETLAQTEAVHADGLVTTTPGVSVGVYVADCLPILLSAPTGVAALHGGWRSVAAGILKEGIATLCALSGAKPADLKVAIGSGIGPCCFEVGDEVVEIFKGLELQEVVVPQPHARAHIDLPHAAALLAQREGIPAQSIDISDLCTMCEADLYYSYRREGWPTGQMMAIIGIAGACPTP